MFAVLGVLGVWSLWSCVEKAMTVFIMRKKEEQDSKQVHPPYPKVQDNPLQPLLRVAFCYSPQLTLYFKGQVNQLM